MVSRPHQACHTYQKLTLDLVLRLVYDAANRLGRDRTWVDMITGNYLQQLVRR